MPDKEIVQTEKEATDSPKRYDLRGAPVTSFLVSGFKAASAGDVFEDELKNFEDEEDQNIGYYQNAELLMDQLTEGLYTVGRLPIYQKKQIFFYLSVFHPVISRAIKLHTKLPLSSLRLQKPDHEIDIVQDYVFDYFDELLEDTNFRRELKKILTNYWTFGEGVGIIEDDYHKKSDTVMDQTLKTVSLPELDQELVQELEKINKDYNSDPASVPWKDKLRVLKSYILDINKDFEGIINFRSVFPLDILGTLFNPDVDYYLYQLPQSDILRTYMSNKTLDEKARKTLIKMGYSEAIIDKNVETLESNIEIDNDPFNGEGVYAVRLSPDENLGVDSSILNSALEPAVQNLNAIRRANTLVSLSSKIDRIVSADNASAGQLAQLQDDLQAMAESPEGSMLAVNFDVQIEEISLSVKEGLDLDDVIDRTDKEILSSMGMPEELIRDGGTYGSGFLKVELLTNEYVELRNTMKDFIENQIFKPIAIKKGFVTVNEWGKTVPLYPTIRFDKFSLSRSSEDLSQMMSMVNDNQLPVEILLEHMGYNPEDIEQKLLRQQTSILNESMQELMDNAIAGLEDDLINSPEFKQRILDELGLIKPDENNEPSEDEYQE